MVKTNFDELFWNSDGQSIEYQSKVIFRQDKIALEGGEERFRYRILSTNSESKQGFALRTYDKQCRIVFPNGDEVSGKTWSAIWENDSPSEDTFACEGRGEHLRVKNIWEDHHGNADSWHNGAAMWKEAIPNGWRYHCNDWHPDDDFDDIIFEIVRIDEKK